MCLMYDLSAFSRTIVLYANLTDSPNLTIVPHLNVKDSTHLTIVPHLQVKDSTYLTTFLHHNVLDDPYLTVVPRPRVFPRGSFTTLKLSASDSHTYWSSELCLEVTITLSATVNNVLLSYLFSILS